MTSHTTRRPAVSPGPRRRKGPGAAPGAPGFEPTPLTQRKTKLILGRRDSTHSVKGKSAGTARFAPCRASLRAVSPAHTGRNTMPRSRGVLRSLAFNLSRSGGLHGRLAAGSALLALALGASLVSAPAQAQDGQIVNPGSMAVTGFSGTTIPGIEEGLPPGVDPIDETFIDTTRATLRVFDVSALGGPPSRPTRLHAAALRGAGRPDRPGLRTDL